MLMNHAEFKRGWHGGLPETVCGHGSKISQTEVQREWLPRMVEKYDIHDIVDIGAGDLRWIKLIDWPHPIEYQAYDLVPRDKSVIKFDLIHEVPPKADLIICAWLLNHLPEDHARVALNNIMTSGAKYLIYTWWPAIAGFLDLGSLESTVIRTAYREGHKISYEMRIVKC